MLSLAELKINNQRPDPFSISLFLSAPIQINQLQVVY
jgi:hypothetical protein